MFSLAGGAPGDCGQLWQVPVPMAEVAGGGRGTMVSDNNLLLPPPYTEISPHSNTNIIKLLITNTEAALPEEKGESA